MKYSALAIPWLVLAGCGGSADNREDAAGEDAGGGPIGEAYVDALDKAEAVDALARERKDQLDEAAEADEQP